MSTPLQPPAATKRPRWQFGLRTLALLIAALGVWMADFVNRRDIRALKPRIATLSNLAPELSVDDPKQVTFVELAKHSMADHRWEVYLPNTHYRLCLATRDIPDQLDEFPSVFQSKPLTAGRHRIKLEMRQLKDEWKIVAILDDREAISIREPADWNLELGSSSQASVELPEGKGVILRDESFLINDGTRPASQQPPPGLGGVRLWIDRTVP